MIPVAEASILEAGSMENGHWCNHGIVDDFLIRLHCVDTLFSLHGLLYYQQCVWFDTACTPTILISYPLTQMAFSLFELWFSMLHHSLLLITASSCLVSYAPYHTTHSWGYFPQLILRHPAWSRSCVNSLLILPGLQLPPLGCSRWYTPHPSWVLISHSGHYGLPFPFPPMCCLYCFAPLNGFRTQLLGRKRNEKRDSLSIILINFCFLQTSVTFKKQLLTYTSIQYLCN